jgi:phosphate-selective porin OprO/OprP
VTWTHYYDEESKGRYLVHLGIGADFRTFNTNVSATTGFDNVRVRSRGVLRNAASTLDPNFADTGNFYAESQTVLDPELAVVWGPWFIQSEYTTSWFNGAQAAQNIPSGLGRVFMQGGYAEVLYFLTGEHKEYGRQAGTFGRVVPNNNFNVAKGTYGGWQVGVRFDWLDLNSGTNTGTGSIVNGGNAQDMTLGLNWFLNANARFQFNYVCSWVNNAPPVTYPGTVGALNGSRFVGDGTINSFGARMDFNF